MKKKTLFTLLLSFLNLFALVLGIHTKVVQGVSADVIANPNAYTDEHVRIIVAPDIDDGKDYFYEGSARAGLIIFSDLDDQVAKGQSYNFNEDETRIIHDTPTQHRNYGSTGNGRKFLFFDLKYSEIQGKRFQVARLNPAGVGGVEHYWEIWGVTQPQVFTDANLTKVIKIQRVSGSNPFNLWFSESAGAGFDDKIVALLLGGYLSCSPSSINGYGAYAGLNATYVLTNRLSSTEKVKDFPDETYYTSGKTSENAVNIDLGVKIAQMQALYQASQETVTSSKQLSNYLNIIVVISLVGITSLLGFYFLRKKPKSI
ncbi:MAG: hypothetical protein WCZ47_02625 [Bacilli bacterium]|jgi:hypothetical protein|nr:hypothetical protein [Erysipelotrichia bacterium]